MGVIVVEEVGGWGSSVEGLGGNEAAVVTKKGGRHPSKMVY